MACKSQFYAQHTLQFWCQNKFLQKFRPTSHSFPPTKWVFPHPICKDGRYSGRMLFNDDKRFIFCQQISLLHCQWPVENNNSILSGELKSFRFRVQQAILSNALIGRSSLGTRANRSWQHSRIKLIKPHSILNILKYPPRCFKVLPPQVHFQFPFINIFNILSSPIMNFDFNGIFILICFVSNNPIKHHEH